MMPALVSDASIEPPSHRPGRTYLLLSAGAALVLLALLPLLLVAFGLMGDDSLQGAGTLTGMFFGLPAFLVLVVALGFSIAALIRGPARLRLHVGIWWVLMVGTVLVGDATKKEPGFNPYLGIPHPGLGVSDVILAVGLLLGVVLPLMWRRTHAR